MLRLDQLIYNNRYLSLKVYIYHLQSDLFKYMMNFFKGIYLFYASIVVLKIQSKLDMEYNSNWIHQLIMGNILKAVEFVPQTIKQ